jgi:hypothetical protein
VGTSELVPEYFIIYWIITFLKIIPKEYLFKGYSNPLMVAWKWSFFPLDLMISIIGLTGLFLFWGKNNLWKNLVFISLILTFCSGFQAISFWIIRSDFDIYRWIPNLYLVIYPLFFVPLLLKVFMKK